MSDWSEAEDVLRFAMEESGGERDSLGIVYEPVTGLPVRIPTDKERREIRGAEGTAQIIDSPWEPYRNIALNL